MTAAAATQFVAIVTDDAEYADHTQATASWYDRYRLVGGEYPVAFTTISGRPVRDGESPYYAQIVVEAELTESYRENRLLGEVRGKQTRPRKTTTVRFTPYAHQITDGEAVAYNSDRAPIVTIAVR
ncbi:hypothetical protein [Gordonia alkanivorans]|uniref:hypothetical protein n=1 Tax=Gordonia alkanivorans TaxID=84096 RepID=UPI0004B8DC68|nr:hypothetical protein [Gordonia alkanivorans]